MLFRYVDCMVASVTLQVAKDKPAMYKSRVIPSFITTLKIEFTFLTLYFPIHLR